MNDPRAALGPALTVREVATRLNVTEKTVYRLAMAGRLPAFKVAGTWRFLSEDLHGWIEQQKARGARPDLTAPEEVRT